MNAAQEFEAVIGLEVHVQLATDSKLFCGCSTKPSDSVNRNVCPICAGHPGTLPVLNEKVAEYAVRAGLATGCTINPKSQFARKNYFYPDLPKGYQISQFENPICENGFLEIETGSEKKKVAIQRIHIEEDAGKSVHADGYSMVNLNRAAVPLVEIVSGPDMRSSAEAGAYLRGLYAIVTYLGICEGNLQQGNFRCDANVSVMPKGSSKFGTRTEIKNVNSFRFVEKAIDYEIARQIQVIRSGGKIIQETRLYDSDKNITSSMRSKEESHDYRYFPDPDLMRIQLSEAFIQKVKASLPELPEQKRGRYVSQYGLTPYDAGVLTQTKSMAQFFDHAVELAKDSSLAKGITNIITGTLARLLNDSELDVSQSKVTPKHVADLAQLIQGQVISSTGAKAALNQAWKTGESVESIVDSLGLKQVSDLSSLEPAIDQIIAANPKQAEEFRAGKDKLLGFFVGQVMKATGGKANPAMLGELVKKKLSGG
ncbi:MAG: Asp-tRNA(Asn)/Glu-tRNA(Gln) amidotransferase subunit GatB [Bdellovibrionales bacterium]|nr:Asp-tRNA(Asn)/Glu-tRNA(Gln) amidotransferase subunit GatB [Bdellovibrionales bacterium]